MDIPYSTIFVGLLLAYLVYSVWARLDGRYPIVAALVLLVVTAVVDAAGDVDAANSLAEYVFFLLAAGVVLLLIEHVRDRPAPTPATESGGPAAERVAPETPKERKGSTEHPLDSLEQKAVPVVDGTGSEHEKHEQPGDREPEDGQPQPPIGGERGVQDGERKTDGDGGRDDGHDEVPVERVDPG